MQKSNFIPQVYFIGGEYVVNRLTNDGVSIHPSFSKIKEVELDKIYNINDKEKINIPAFAGYTIKPENDQALYTREVDFGDNLKNFNLYELPFHPNGFHQISDDAVNWPNIYNLLLHIAPNTKPFSYSRFTYAQLLFDYLAIAWKDPAQRLPILVLVSKERSTGKTTFLNLIQLMFQSNAKIVTMNDLSSDFNLPWGLANFIMVDEARIPKNLITKIREESTSRYRIINAKYLTQFIIPNYSKFIMASNEIESFADIDIDENRYFVIEVGPFTLNKEIPDYIQLIKDEIPHFLDYLKNHHELFTLKESRTWFNYNDYKTPALEKITNNSESATYFMVEDLLEELYQISHGKPEDLIWEFSLTNLRKRLNLNKGKEREIKYALIRLGVQTDDCKKRFTCTFSGTQTHAIRYFISISELNSLFNKVDMEVFQPA